MNEQDLCFYKREPRELSQSLHHVRIQGELLFWLLLIMGGAQVHHLEPPSGLKDLPPNFSACCLLTTLLRDCSLLESHSLCRQLPWGSLQPTPGQWGGMKPSLLVAPDHSVGWPSFQASCDVSSCLYWHGILTPIFPPSNPAHFCSPARVDIKITC